MFDGCSLDRRLLFLEPPQGEVHRIYLPRTRMNKGWEACSKTVRCFRSITHASRKDERRRTPHGAMRESSTQTEGVLLRDVAEGDLPVFFEHQRNPVASRMADFPPRNWDAFVAHWTKILADETVLREPSSLTGAWQVTW